MAGSPEYVELTGSSDDSDGNAADAQGGRVARMALTPPPRGQKPTGSEHAPEGLGNAQRGGKDTPPLVVCSDTPPSPDIDGQQEDAPALVVQLSDGGRSRDASGSDASGSGSRRASDDDDAAASGDGHLATARAQMALALARQRSPGQVRRKRTRAVPVFPQDAFETVGEGLLRFPWMVYPKHLATCLIAAAKVARRERGRVMRGRLEGEEPPPPQRTDASGNLEGIPAALRRLCIDLAPDSFEKCFDDSALKNWDDNIQCNILEAAIGLGELVVARLALHSARNEAIEDEEGGEVPPWSAPDEGEDLAALLGALARTFDVGSLFHRHHRHDPTFPGAASLAAQDAVYRSAEISAAVGIVRGAGNPGTPYEGGIGCFARPAAAGGPGSLVRMRSRTASGLEGSGTRLFSPSKRPQVGDVGSLGLSSDEEDSYEEDSLGGASMGKVGRPLAENTMAAHLVEVFCSCGGLKLIVEWLDQLPPVQELEPLLHVLASASSLWTDAAVHSFDAQCFKVLERVMHAFTEIMDAEGPADSADGDSLFVASLADANDGSLATVSQALEHLERIIALSVGEKNAGAQVARVRCGLVEMLLAGAPSFRKQLTAVRELSKLLGRVSALNVVESGPASEHAQGASVPSVLEWLESKGVLKTILRSNFHHRQYVEQVANVMLFLVQEGALREEHLADIWGVVEDPEQHDSVKTTTLGLLTTLAWHFNTAQLDALFARFESILVRGDSRSALRAVDAMEALVGDRDSSGLMTDRVVELLWRALVGNGQHCGTSDDDVAAALIDALSGATLKAGQPSKDTSGVVSIHTCGVREKLINRAVAVLARPGATARCLGLLRALLRLYPSSIACSGSVVNLQAFEDTRAERLQVLQENLQLTERLVDLVCRRPLTGGVETRDCELLLEFLDFVLTSADGRILLSEECTLRLWDVLVGDGAAGPLADYGLQWVSKLLKGKPLLDASALRALLRALEGLRSSALAESALYCVLASFVWANVQGSQKLRMGDDINLVGGDMTEFASAAAILTEVSGAACGAPPSQASAGLPSHDSLSADDVALDGFEVVWRAALEAPHTELVVYCQRLICHLYMSAACSAAADDCSGFAEICARFISVCTGELRGKSPSNDAVTALRTERALQMLRIFLDMCELQRWEVRPTAHGTSFAAPPFRVQVTHMNTPEAFSVPSNVSLAHFSEAVLARFKIDRTGVRAVLSQHGIRIAGDGLPLSALGVNCEASLQLAVEPAPSAQEAACLPASAHPGAIVAGDASVFDLLYNLDTCGSASVRSSASLLLGRLPTDPRLLRVCDELAQSSANVGEDLFGRLFREGVPLLYALQVLHAALSPEASQDFGRRAQLLNALTRCNARAKLIEVLETIGGNATAAHRDALRVQTAVYSAASVLDVLMHHSETTRGDPNASEELQCDRDAEDTAAALAYLSVSRRLPVVTGTPSATDALASVGAGIMHSVEGCGECSVVQAFLYKTCFEGVMRRAHGRGRLPNVLRQLLDADKTGELIASLLLETESGTSRRALTRALHAALSQEFKDCASATKTAGQGTENVEGASIDSGAEPILRREVLEVLKLLAPFRQQASDYRVSCNEYFWLLSWACENVPFEGDGSAVARDAGRLLCAIANDESKFLMQEPTENGEEDAYVRGRLHLMSKVCKQLYRRRLLSGSLAAHAATLLVARWLFPEGLLLSPEAMESITGDGCGGVPATVPGTRLCDLTRANAYQLLSGLCQDSPEALRTTLVCLRCVHFHGGADIVGWEKLPAQCSRSHSTRVGLQNAGATCYMNSVIQQLFMQPQVRARVQAIPEPACHDERTESVLYQLQSVFGALQGTSADFHQPQGFWNAFRDYDGTPVDLREHQDAVEFFTRLVDQVDEEARRKDGKSEGFVPPISGVLGGTFAQQVIGRTCPHRSEREEPFQAITLEVQGFDSLHESLAAYVRGELLEGDNAYNCDKCGAKVSALKRVCVRRAPRTLLLHLRRFDFDYETMQRLKLRDHFAFPMELDLEPYTVEGLEAEDMDQEGDARRAHLSGKYRYELAGVVVHSGTAFAGHYYSIARDRESGQWLCFDDTRVTPYDVSQLEADCFGGKIESVGQDGNPIEYDRPNSAYMLVYEKCQRVESEAMVLEAPAHRSASQGVFLQGGASAANAAAKAGAAAGPAPTPAPTPSKPDPRAKGGLAPVEAAIAAAAAVIGTEGGELGNGQSDDHLRKQLLRLARPPVSAKDMGVAMPKSVHRCVVERNLRLMHERQVLNEWYFNFVRDLLHGVFEQARVLRQRQLTDDEGRVDTASTAAEEGAWKRVAVVASQVAAEFTFSICLKSSPTLRSPPFLQRWGEVLNALITNSPANIKAMGNRIGAKPAMLRQYVMRCQVQDVRAYALNVLRSLLFCSGQFNDRALAVGAEGASAGPSVGTAPSTEVDARCHAVPLWDAVLGLRSELGAPKLQQQHFLELAASGVECSTYLASVALETDLLTRCLLVFGNTRSSGNVMPSIKHQALPLLLRLIKELVRAGMQQGAACVDAAGGGRGALSACDAVALGAMHPSLEAPRPAYTPFIRDVAVHLASNEDVKLTVKLLCWNNAYASAHAVKGILAYIEMAEQTPQVTLAADALFELVGPSMCNDSARATRTALALVGERGSDPLVISRRSLLGFLLGESACGTVVYRGSADANAAAAGQSAGAELNDADTDGSSQFDRELVREHRAEILKMLARLVDSQECECARQLMSGPLRGAWELAVSYCETDLTDLAAESTPFDVQPQASIGGDAASALDAIRAFLDVQPVGIARQASGAAERRHVRAAGGSPNTQPAHPPVGDLDELLDEDDEEAEDGDSG